MKSRRSQIATHLPSLLAGRDQGFNLPLCDIRVYFPSTPYTIADHQTPLSKTHTITIYSPCRTSGRELIDIMQLPRRDQQLFSQVSHAPLCELQGCTIFVMLQKYCRLCLTLQGEMPLVSNSVTYQAEHPQMPLGKQQQIQRLGFLLV